MINIETARQRIDKLIKEINHHRYLYHVLDKSEISDGALDSLKRELADLEKQFPSLLREDSPTQRVSGTPLKKFVKVKHSKKILSLTDAFDIKEVQDWQERNEKIIKQKIKGYYAELKLDGLTVVLTYQKGLLWQGTTRGDGIFGENVTNNLKTIDSIPLSLRNIKNKKLPNIIEVRGEAVIDKKNFVKINKGQVKRDLPVFANSRNLTAGSIRQ